MARSASYGFAATGGTYRKKVRTRTRWLSSRPAPLFPKAELGSKSRFSAGVLVLTVMVNVGVLWCAHFKVLCGVEEGGGWERRIWFTLHDFFCLYTETGRTRHIHNVDDACVHKVLSRSAANSLVYSFIWCPASKHSFEQNLVQKYQPTPPLPLIFNFISFILHTCVVCDRSLTLPCATSYSADVASPYPWGSLGS